MRFPYDATQRPTLPLSLSGPNGSCEAVALVDSGADVNVLPWNLGLALGLVWNPNKATLRVAGIPDRAAAMPVLIPVSFADFSRITLGFAWCQSENVPLVLGQTNFFIEFDICFFRSRMEFQVVRRSV
jgi:hypothetical protein